MSKSRAEQGLVPVRDLEGKLFILDGAPDFQHTDSRWLGNGRTVLNNKGNPIKQYEPCFSCTHEYAAEAELVKQGFTPIVHYEPLDRVIRTELPNGTESKVEFGPGKAPNTTPAFTAAPTYAMLFK